MDGDLIEGNMASKKPATGKILENPGKHLFCKTCVADFGDCDKAGTKFLTPAPSCHQQASKNRPYRVIKVTAKQNVATSA